MGRDENSSTAITDLPIQDLQELLVETEATIAYLLEKQGAFSRAVARERNASPARIAALMESAAYYAHAATTPLGLRFELISRIDELQRAAELRRVRQERLANPTIEIERLLATASTLSGSEDQTTALLGNILGRILRAEELALVLPEIIENDISHYSTRNAGSRIAVGNESDNVRLMLIANGEVAVGYHPKTPAHKDAVGKIVSQLGMTADTYFIGFRADSEGTVLRPFGLLKELTSFGNLIRTPVDLPVDDPDLQEIQSHVNNILANGIVSLSVNGKRETLLPQ